MSLLRRHYHVWSNVSPNSIYRKLFKNSIGTSRINNWVGETQGHNGGDQKKKNRKFFNSISNKGKRTARVDCTFSNVMSNWNRNRSNVHHRTKCSWLLFPLSLSSISHSYSPHGRVCSKVQTAAILVPLALPSSRRGLKSESSERSIVSKRMVRKQIRGKQKMEGAQQQCAHDQPSAVHESLFSFRERKDGETKTKLIFI